MDNGYASWSFFRQARRVLGDAFFTRLFRVGRRQLQRWSADPAHTDEPRNNPIDRINTILNALEKRGERDLALEGVKLLAAGRRASVVPYEEVSPNVDGVTGSMLRDYPALVTLHKAMMDQAGEAEVRALLHRAKLELDDTLAHYLRETRRAE
ncbi:hypothetical protein [Desulfohalovibrio reitneri]|uniref:hypothetical protein n=1 Tax=Desulfohalovibrio reitneri TaxID=1307759 RepID=UPI0004A74D83|nr:hypothetical protein [Desulfohalovibrio reitneri]